jgi:hypothetical protein
MKSKSPNRSASPPRSRLDRSFEQLIGSISQNRSVIYSFQHARSYRLSYVTKRNAAARVRAPLSVTQPGKCHRDGVIMVRCCFATAKRFCVDDKRQTRPLAHQTLQFETRRCGAARPSLQLPLNGIINSASIRSHQGFFVLKG